MSLIQVAKDSLSTLLSDNMHREFFYCNSLGNNMLMVKGQKQKGFGENKGADNIISNGSVVSVNAGQCMIIVDQGRIVEFCAEPGEFTYDASSEPTFLYGGFTSENIKNVAKQTVSQFARRVSFAGTAKDQRVYYINTKEIQNNLYGTPTPMPFHFVSKSTGFEMETTVKCNGRYTFKIVDPIQFYTNIAGNVEDEYPKSEEFLATLKAELLTVLPEAMGQVAADGVLPSQLHMHAPKIADYLKDALTPDWTEKRGLEIVSMTMSPPIIPEKDMERLNKWYDTAVLTNANMAAARQTEAYTRAIENISEGGSGGQGENGEGGGASPMGAVMGMWGMGMMQNMMNNTMNGMSPMAGMNPMGGAAQTQQSQQPQMMPASTVAEGAILGWNCSCGKTDNRSRFCENCGLPKPALDGWTCSCGSVNQGKFCQDCGRKKPEGAPLYKCDKCGWVPEDPTKPPKFCPECGDPFDENDIV